MCFKRHLLLRAFVRSWERCCGICFWVFVYACTRMCGFANASPAIDYDANSAVHYYARAAFLPARTTVLTLVAYLIRLPQPL